MDEARFKRYEFLTVKGNMIDSAMIAMILIYVLYKKEQMKEIADLHKKCDEAENAEMSYTEGIYRLRKVGDDKFAFILEDLERLKTVPETEIKESLGQLITDVEECQDVFGRAASGFVRKRKEMCAHRIKGINKQLRKRVKKLKKSVDYTYTTD